MIFKKVKCWIDRKKNANDKSLSGCSFNKKGFEGISSYDELEDNAREYRKALEESGGQPFLRRGDLHNQE